MRITIAANGPAVAGCSNNANAQLNKCAYETDTVLVNSLHLAEVLS